MPRKPRLTSLDAPRIRFNWGYHDAAAEYKAGCPRLVVDRGEQTTRRVSMAAGSAYAYGYQAGLRDTRHGEYHGWSEKAWEGCGEAQLLQVKFVKTFKRQGGR